MMGLIEVKDALKIEIALRPCHLIFLCRYQLHESRTFKMIHTAPSRKNTEWDSHDPRLMR